MEAAQHESGLADRVLPPGPPLYAVRGVESRVQQELSDQFESAVAFADFCSFLTADKVSAQAEQLAGLARALYAETTADLRRSRPRG